MDATPGLELFENYESDLQQVISSANDKIQQAHGSASGSQGGDAQGSHRSAVEAKKAGLRRAEMELEEADEIVCYVGPTRRVLQ